MAYFVILTNGSEGDVFVITIMAILQMKERKFTELVSGKRDS